MTRDVLTETMNRAVTQEELREALDAPIPESERAEIVALCRWFTTRYPSAEARLGYVRQAYVRWQGAMHRAGRG